MCIGIDLSHWSALSKCFTVGNNCGFEKHIEYVVKKWKKWVTIEVFRFQLLHALQSDLNWFWMHHGFGLDIF